MLCKALLTCSWASLMRKTPPLLDGVAINVCRPAYTLPHLDGPENDQWSQVNLGQAKDTVFKDMWDVNSDLWKFL